MNIPIAVNLEINAAYLGATKFLALQNIIIANYA